MLQNTTLQFLNNLAEHNDRIWFEANKEAYHAAKEDFEVFIGKLLQQMSAHDARYNDLLAKDCIFRIFRDVRFSKDKSPYKPNFGAAINPNGRKMLGAGFYFHLEPNGKSFIGGGMWMPDAPVLKNIRQEIDYNFEEFQQIIEDRSFKKFYPSIEGVSLKKAPKEYTPDNPAIEYLKMKSFTVGYNLKNDADLLDKKLVQELEKKLVVMQPFIDFLNRALDKEPNI